MEKQTAVEWLEEELADNLKVIILNNDYTLMEKLFAKAKAMEKEQINKACYDGYYKEDEKYTYDYYNETFNK
jgi:hypothetical protein